jgi:hypothetical protein
MVKLCRADSKGKLAIFQVLVVISLLSILSACQTLNERKQSDQLQSVLRNYEGVIRWGSIGQAQRFQHPDETNEVQNRPEVAIRVTHYDVVQGPTMIDDNTAIQTALIQYVLVDTQVVREVLNQQTWKYDSEEKAWFLTSPLPVLK